MAQHEQIESGRPSPSLTGRSIGPYEVLEPIGSGGMGDVYRARDTTLKRDVALKVLPSLFVMDPDRLARFRREAQVVAAINHPNIAAIYGFTEADGVPALALELVEGPTLADRIARGPLPFDEALPIARQLADALEAAHDQGIVHRDLKPANIKVRADGTVKVLDFGLAKAFEPHPFSDSDVVTSPTITSPAVTRAGILLGTAAYMSPEQAKGRPVDRRADLWALGAVLYEMLTARRAFKGEDVSDTLAYVLTKEPDWSALPSDTPVSIRRLLRRCLEKDRKRRLDSAAVVRLEIDDALSSPGDPSLSPGPPARHRVLARTAIVAGTAAVAAYIGWAVRPATVPPQPLARFTIPLPAGERFSANGVHLVAISPDGRRLVYVANLRLFTRTLDQLEATPIRGTEGDATTAGRNPFFSPDGQWIGFWQTGQLKKVSVAGGTPVVVCDEVENPWGASWASDNTILYGQAEDRISGIWRVSANGGKPERLIKLDPGQVAQHPQLLPGGRAVLFALAMRPDWNAAQVVVQSLATGERRVVVQPGGDVRYVPTGHLVYALGGTLFAIPFDAARLTTTGSAIPLVDDMATTNITAHFATATQGSLVYVPAGALGPPPQIQRTLVWVDRQGHEEPTKAPPRPYFYPRLSPDGTRVALDIREQPGDIWLWDLARDTLTRLTLGATFEQYGIWTPDGRSVIFASSQFGGPTSPRSLFRIAADGTGSIERLTEGTVAQFPSSVTPDGAALIFRSEATTTRVGARPSTDLLLLPLQGERRPRPLVNTPFDELNGEVSPDGRWLAYESNESGQSQIYVRPFPNVDGGRWQVSTNGGTQPLWARDGRELFFVSGRALMHVAVTPTTTFKAGIPATLLEGEYIFAPPGGGLGRMYDVSPDGKRFLLVKGANNPTEDRISPRMILVQNWLEDLKRRAGSSR